MKLLKTLRQWQYQASLPMTVTNARRKHQQLRGGLAAGI